MRLMFPAAIGYVPAPPCPLQPAVPGPPIMPPAATAAAVVAKKSRRDRFDLARCALIFVHLVFFPEGLTFRC